MPGAERAAPDSGVRRRWLPPWLFQGALADIAMTIPSWGPPSSAAWFCSPSSAWQSSTTTDPSVMPDAGCRMLDAACRMLDAGCLMLDA